jgi:hypothetical protein
VEQDATEARATMGRSQDRVAINCLITIKKFNEYSKCLIVDHSSQHRLAASSEVFGQPREIGDQM